MQPQSNYIRILHLYEFYSFSHDVMNQGCNNVSTSKNPRIHIFPNVYIFLGIASWHLLHAGFLFAWFSTLKMELVRSSATSVHIRSTQRYIAEDGNIHNYGCENLKTLRSIWFKVLNQFRYNLRTLLLHDLHCNVNVRLQNTSIEPSLRQLPTFVQLPEGWLETRALPYGHNA
jgi:hypothetical protein